MAKTEDLQKSLEKLNSGGPISFGGESLKKKILKKKLKSVYEESLSSEDLDKMVEEIYRSGKGELMGKLDSELALISNSLNSVITQSPILLGQMAGLPAALIQTTAAGPTVPNPIDIKNSLDQIKSQAATLGSVLSLAIGKVIEFGIEDEIPESVIDIVDTISSIKNFPS